MIHQSKKGINTFEIFRVPYKIKRNHYGHTHAVNHKLNTLLLPTEFDEYSRGSI